MVIRFTRSFDNGNKTYRNQILCQKYFFYPRILRIIRAAIHLGYGLYHITDNEIQHNLIFIKYEPGTKTLISLAVAGTGEEITDIQKDEIVSASILRR